MLKRLIYQLRLEINSNFYKLIDFHTRNKIPHFYNDIDDFKKRTGEIIINNIDSMQLLIINKSFSFRIYKNLQPNLTKYLIQNQTLLGNNELHVITTFSTLQNGFKLLYNADDLLSFKLITISGNKIKDILQVDGIPTAEEITVIAIKKNGKIVYLFLQKY